MDAQLLKDLARYQRWADEEHWKVFHHNPALMNDEEIRKRLNHMIMGSGALCGVARGEGPPQPGTFKEHDSADAIENAMRQAADILDEALASSDLEKIIAVPRGPKGPFNASAGALLLQVLLHSQQHRAQNASRMRELGVNPPMTDYIFWYALGMP